MDLTSALAIYAALVSTLTAAWTARQLLLDRGRLSTTFGFDGRDEEGIPILTVRMTNVGHRPIMILHSRQEWADGRRLDVDINAMLQPGTFHERNIQNARTFVDLEAMSVFDSTGHCWRVPGRQIEDAKRRCRTLQGSG